MRSGHDGLDKVQQLSVSSSPCSRGLYVLYASAGASYVMNGPDLSIPPPHLPPDPVVQKRNVKACKEQRRVHDLAFSRSPPFMNHKIVAGAGSYLISGTLIILHKRLDQGDKYARAMCIQDHIQTDEMRRIVGADT